jgi:hypothetical protein
MSEPRSPSFEPRRRRQLEQELLDRARAWLPEWRPRERGDFGAALLAIAARIGSEVTQRLDRAPEKTFRGFLHWLGVRGQPGRAARLPVVFKMAPGSEPVDALPPVQLQATPAGVPPVVLETESALRILPGQLATLVAADPARDAFFRPPPGVLSLEPPRPLPSEWRLRSEVGAGATQLQLEPALGLEVGLVLIDPASGGQYRVQAIEGSIVNIDPALGPEGLDTGARLVRSTVFAGLDETARNQQEHALYLGATEALNIETPAVIEVLGAAAPADASWSYWGKPSATQPATWLPFDPPVIAGGRFLLFKPAGAIEETQVAGRKSRFLRATRAAGTFVEASEGRGMRLLVNCEPDSEGWPAPIKARIAAAGQGSGAARVPLEGIAGTSPLVLDAPFYPLGREPRIFDSFYLGSQEAFSKPAAKVSLHFEIGDSFSGPLAAVALHESHLVAAVGKDRRLHRLWQTSAAVAETSFPVLEFLPLTQPVREGRPVLLNPGFRPGLASHDGFTGHVTVGAGSEVWKWRQSGRFDSDSWESLGTPVAPEPVQDTALVRSTRGLWVYALAGGRLHRREATVKDEWKVVTDVPPRQELRRIAPIVRVGGDGGEASDGGLAAISAEGKLLLRDGAGVWTESTRFSFDFEAYPLVVDLTEQRLCFARVLQPGGPRLAALDLDGPPDDASTLDGELIGRVVAFVPRDGTVAAVAASKRAGGAVLPVLWSPFSPDGSAEPIAGEPPLTFSDGPVVVEASVLFPGDRGAIGIVPLDPLLQTVEEARLSDVAVASDPASDWSSKQNLLLSYDRPGGRQVRAVSKVLRAPDAGPWLFVLAGDPGDPVAGPTDVDVHARAEAKERTGTVVAPPTARRARKGARATADRNRLQLEAGDDVDALERLYVTGNGREALLVVTGVADTEDGARVATVDGDLPAEVGQKVAYRKLESRTLPRARLLPAVDAGPLRPEVRDQILRVTLHFERLDPEPQRASRFVEELAVLAVPWRSRPRSARARLQVRAAFGVATVMEPERPHNPELSWEYWDGSGWWRIPDLVDQTGHLVRTGDVAFCVPPNLQPTDVVGRSNHWIRARLVGGDYGKESVKISSTPVGDGATVQTIDRNSDNIRAPFVISLDAAYQLCCPVLPDFVFTTDSGVTRDQGDANRTGGATVEYFVPLPMSLAALAAPGEAATPDGGPALYLGFDAELRGGPITLLFLVDEGSHDLAFPLRVEALSGAHFTPVVSQDGTRGLNESGLCSLTLAESPRPAELFGEIRRWLRLRPSASFSGAWRPRIRRAFLNATFATAADTQTLELLGSSDGSPDQQVSLARPPVLAGSLVLRVREPLGDEEVEVLRAGGPEVVREGLGGRPGRWVRWREVADPADFSPEERVYALDADRGTVRFGDGAHGKVPPIGADSILAERYQRGGGEVANRVAAWSQISLTTPLPGVEGVLAPEGAAGGADSQTAEQAIRFAPANLRMRDRALAASDFELLAVQASPQVAQTRALPVRAGVRLVVVARGREPRPSRALLRELRRHLLERAAPPLARPGALQLVAPELIPLRVRLQLTIDAIEHSGSVAAAASAALQQLLDPALGGLDGRGWPVGEVPSDADLAAVLIGLPHLESIDDCRLVQVEDEAPIGRTLGPSQLLHLIDDGVVVACRVEQAEAA